MADAEGLNPSAQQGRVGSNPTPGTPVGVARLPPACFALRPERGDRRRDDAVGEFEGVGAGVQHDAGCEAIS